MEYATTGHGGLYDVADVSGLWAVSWWISLVGGLYCVDHAAT